MAEQNWGDQEVEKLKALIAEGLTSGQIHKRMPSRSRCAVIGKAHRMGLTIGTSASTRAAIRRGAEAAAIKRRVARTAKTAAKKPPAPAAKSAALFKGHSNGPVVIKGPELPPCPFAPVEEVVIPLAERKTIQTLEANDCRWPIGDPHLADFHFCGRTKVPGLPYCEGHARRAYAPPQAKRRETEAEARPVAVKVLA